jgi:heterodisulfide reductase subunit A
MRIGVYVCHCGRNIAEKVDVAAVAEFASKIPDVVVARDYRFMCSDPGQELIKNDIKELKLDRVVVSACTPTMHRNTFMNSAAQAGMNPYCVERANIRENCSWVHGDNNDATEKAKHLVAASIARVRLSEQLSAKEVKVTPSALVIGGGIAGIQAALDIAGAGFKVYLVEREQSLGGNAMKLDRTFPDMESAPDFMNRKIDELRNSTLAEVFTGSEVAEVSGYIGNFTVQVKNRFNPDDKNTELAVGAIIVATGYDHFDPRLKPELGYGTCENILTAPELEALVKEASARSEKPLINGKEPRNIVFIQCVGSRDRTVKAEYCSRVCCMYTAKQALYLREAFPEARITVCYIDVRAFGRGNEEFYDQVQRKKIIYRRGVVSEIYKKGDRALVQAEDSLLGESYLEEADLVLLATGLRPSESGRATGRLLNISTGADGFFLEAHPKLGPVETTTDGVFLAGCSVGPKDISDSISQAHAAAIKACIPLFMKKVKTEPLVAHIDPEACSGCRLCENACEYQALVFDVKRNVMTVNAALCRGCGACSPYCTAGANQLTNTTKKQIIEMIDNLV